MCDGTLCPCNLYEEKWLFSLISDQADVDPKTGLEYYPAWCAWIILVATGLAMLGLLAS